MICKQLSDCFSAEECSNGRNFRDCCDHYDSRSIHRCVENGKSYCLSADGIRVAVYHIDGGVIINDKTVDRGYLRCDYLMLLEDKSTAVLIELKGVDYGKAIDQLLSTYKEYKEFLNAFSSVYARIICKSVSPAGASSPNKQRLISLLTKHNGTLLSRKKLHEEYNPADKSLSEK